MMISRYSRQMTLPEIGGEGQRRLSEAKAAVVGAGGLGSPVLYYLASAGFGHIKIIDSDICDITNLNRQFIHFGNDMGREKAQSAKDKLVLYNNEITVCAETVMLDDQNAPDCLSGHDIVLSCVDNKKTRRLINKVCITNNTPFIDGGVQGFEGYILTVAPGITPCFQCIFPMHGLTETAGSTGVIGAAAGVIGSMMALEAIKLITGIPICPYFQYVDLLSYRLTPITARKARDCPVCGQTG